MIFTLGLGLVPGGPAAAQAAGVTMTVTPYLGGHVKYGEWLPLRVYLSNDGGDLEAEVRADVVLNNGRVVYALPISLPAGARKEVVLYVLPPTYARTLDIQLLQGEQVLAQVSDVDVSAHPQNEYLVAAVGPNTDALSLLGALNLPGRAQTRFVPLELADLPERVEALRSLDCLILAGADSSGLNPAQGEALQAWVELGGRLLIGGGASAPRTLAGLPEALRTVEPGDVVELDGLDGLAEFTGEEVRTDGPFLAAPPASFRGRTVASQDGQSLLVETALGKGWVAYLALDPTGSPFDAWAGTLPFWQRMLEPGSALPPNVPGDITPLRLEAEQMTYALSNLPALDLPSVRWLALMLGAYVVLVGPVNYLLLRRLRRLAWAWVTIPALTLAFSVASFGLGYALRGSDVIVNQISIVPLRPGGGRTAVRSYVGLFSPSRQTYDVEVSRDALVSPMGYQTQPWDSPGAGGYDALNVVQGDPLVVRGLGVNQWAMQTFEAETWLDDDLTVEADLSMEDGRVRGTLHNGLEVPLTDAILLVGRRWARLADTVGAGQTLQIDQALEPSTGNSFPWVLFERFFQSSGPPPREVTLHQSILESYFVTNWGMPNMPSEPTLLAWTDLSPLDVQVAGVRARHVQTTLVAVALPLPATGGRVTLEPGFLNPRLIEMEGEVGECGPGRIYLNRGRGVLEYRLPAVLHGAEVLSLAVRASSPDMGFTGAFSAMQLYDWTSGEWVTLAESVDSTDAGRRYDVDTPGRFIDPLGGTLRLQVRRDDWQGSCYEFDLVGEMVRTEGAQ